MEALNSKDQAKVTSFVQSNFDSAIPADHRATRVMGLANQGAPFKIVRMRVESDSEVEAAVQDKNGETLGWTLNLDKDGKIATIQVQSADSLDAPPPKDYTGWSDLGKLAEAIRSDTGAPAMAISVLHGRKIETGLAGQRVVGKDDPVRMGDAFSIGSIGKPLCTRLSACSSSATSCAGTKLWEMTLPRISMKTRLQRCHPEASHASPWPTARGPRDDARGCGTDRRRRDGSSAIRENYAKDI